MTPFRLLVLPVTLFFLSLAEAKGGLVVSRIKMGVLVSGPTSQDDSLFDITAPSSPFQNSHSATYAGATASTAYDFAWDEQAATADFRLDISHQAIANSQLLFTRSAGFLYLNSTVDLLLTVDGRFDYELHGPYLYTRFDTKAYQTQVPPIVEYFSDGQDADTDFFFPNIGTLVITGSAVIPANVPFTINYSAEMFTFAASNLPMSGDGYIHMTLAPVPEPAMAALLLCAALAALARRRGTPAGVPLLCEQRPCRCATAL
jgi:hypothetical protein